ncbi:MAG: DNA replication and repair protein RecF [Puniceicoccales bacterium]|jgi:DNA replication and repair protein RecF|nr:DNA replication and repair protein RecF [Puniceicoccales bacterium]
MRLRRLRLSNFRNVAFADAPLDHPRVFLLGGNGQGKTNLLEAAGMLTALRSFRTQDISLLVRHGEKAAQIGFSLTHETEGDTEISLTLEPPKKTLLVDGELVRQLGDFAGRFPAVPFCAADIALLRGAPAARRRWLDIVVAGGDAAYFDALRRYHAALAGRNALLKQPATQTAQLSAFEKTLAPAAAKITTARRAALEALGRSLGRLCAEIGLPENSAALAYAQDSAPGAGDTPAWETFFVRQRSIDILLRSTQRGPHRDDFSFSLGGYPARDAASEGQQRALVLGLELAWLERLRESRPVAPVVLADDILGELDPVRKAGFWRTLGSGCQVIATGTVLPPDASSWHVLDVDNGSYHEQDAPC